MARDPVNFTVEPVSCDMFRVTIDEGSRVYFGLFDDWKWQMLNGVVFPLTPVEINSYTFLFDFSQVDIYIPAYLELSSVFRFYLSYYDEELSGNVDNAYRDTPIIPRSILSDDFDATPVFYPKCWEQSTIEPFESAYRWRMWLKIQRVAAPLFRGPITSYYLADLPDHDRGVIRRRRDGGILLAARRRKVGEPTKVVVWMHTGGKDGGNWSKFNEMWSESVFWYDWVFLPANGGAFSVALKYKASDGKFHWYCKRGTPDGTWPADSSAVEMSGIGARLEGIPFVLNHRDGVFYISASTSRAADVPYAFYSQNGGVAWVGV